jgi:hypothetical protein
VRAVTISEEQLESLLEKRKEDVGLKYLSFLWEDYLPERWFFEVVDMYRRITFIAVLPLAGSGALRASAGILISIFSAALVTFFL